MRDWVALSMAMVGIVNVGVGTWGATYLIVHGHGNSGAVFLCLLAIAMGLALLLGAAR